MILKQLPLLYFMIVIELDGYSLNVPVKPRMDIKEFLSLAERLEVLAEPKKAREVRHEHAAANPIEEFAANFELPKPPRRQEKLASDSIDDFRFEEEDQSRLQHAISALQSNQEALLATQTRIERQEEHIKQILDYLHSLDHHLRN